MCRWRVSGAGPVGPALIELTELPYKLSWSFVALPGVPEDRCALQGGLSEPPRGFRNSSPRRTGRISRSARSDPGGDECDPRIEKVLLELFEYLKKLFAANKG